MIVKILEVLVNIERQQHPEEVHNSRRGEKLEKCGCKVLPPTSTNNAMLELYLNHVAVGVG